jgi:hypothetical protein
MGPSATFDMRKAGMSESFHRARAEQHIKANEPWATYGLVVVSMPVLGSVMPVAVLPGTRERAEPELFSDGNAALGSKVGDPGLGEAPKLWLVLNPPTGLVGG